MGVLKPMPTGRITNAQLLNTTMDGKSVLLLTSVVVNNADTVYRAPIHDDRKANQNVIFYCEQMVMSYGLNLHFS